MSIQAELEFKVDGHTYRAGKLSTLDQLHVASQWRDALLGLALAKKNRPKEVTDKGFREMMGVVFTGALGRLSDDSRERVSRLLLSVVTRKQSGAQGIGWASLTAADGTMMFQDVQLAQLPPIFYSVLDHNGILDFFSGGPSTSDEPREETGTGPHSRTERAG